MKFLDLSPLPILVAIFSICSIRWLLIVDCDHVGAIYTLTHYDPDTGYGGNVTYDILGIGGAQQHFVIVNDQVRTTSSLKLNCNYEYQLYIRAQDNAGKLCFFGKN